MAHRLSAATEGLFDIILNYLKGSIASTMIKDEKTSHRRLLITLLITLVLLVISDGLVSQFLISHGLGREGNPFLMNWITEPYFIAIKISGAILCALILWDIYKHWSKVAMFAITVFLVLYTGIILWNLFVFFTGRM